MKIAVVGGGSTYTPELVDGFARLFPDVTELALVDPPTERLQAFPAHPLIGQHDLATQLTDRHLAANSAHLARIRWVRSEERASDE